jgi:hypothetical protein
MKLKAKISHIEIFDETTSDHSEHVKIEIDVGEHGAAVEVIGFTLDEACRRAVIIADAFINHESKGAK